MSGGRPGMSVPGAGRVLVVAATRAAMEAAIPFARRAAAHLNAPVDAWLADASAHELGLSVDAPTWLGELAGGNDDGEVTVSAAAVRDIPEAVEQYARTHHARLAIAAAAPDEATTPYFRNLVAAPPCELLVLCGAEGPFEPRRVLVATNTFVPLSEDATSLTYALADTAPETRVTFLRMVAPDESDETIAEVEDELRRRIEARQSGLDFEVVVRRSRSYEPGILDALEEGQYDLLIADTPRVGLIARLAERVLPPRLLRSGTPLLLYSAPSSSTARAALRAWNYVYRAIPSTEASQRTSIYGDIRRRSRADADYYVMLSLSVLIASFGLLLDSAAVVIGAMIVAPLMQPIIGLGLGIAMGHLRLTELSLRTSGKGIALALVLAICVGWLLRGDGVTGQLDARGQPGVLDLLVALASGAAGAYASCRKGVAESVAGVAIAVALVPPLATAGIGLAMGQWPLAAGASLLFVTNFVAIGTASSLMFLWMGFKPEAGRFGGRMPLVRGIAVLSLLVGIVAVSLVLWTRAGDARFDRTVRAAVESAVQSIEPDAEVLGIEVRNRDGDVLLVIAQVDTLQDELVRENRLAIQSQISQQLHRPLTLRISVSSR
jgi:uncharacterized hydrophobic protein (TIGR00271 family)